MPAGLRKSARESIFSVLSHNAFSGKKFGKLSILPTAE
jgi:hypothetical protein